jgi:hypothetical protein
MANQYKWDINPFSDSLLEIMIRGGNIVHKDNKKIIFDIFKYILELYLKNEKDIIYLDFQIVNKVEYYTVVGNNIISALWLSGIMPDDSLSVMEKNEFTTKDYRYTFDYKSKKLKYESINYR